MKKKKKIYRAKWSRLTIQLENIKHVEYDGPNAPLSTIVEGIIQYDRWHANGKGIMHPPDDTMTVAFEVTPNIVSLKGLNGGTYTWKSTSREKQDIRNYLRVYYYGITGDSNRHVWVNCPTGE